MSNDRLSISLLTSSYPTELNPYNDVFIRDEARIINRIGDIDVLLTGVFSIPFSGRHNRYKNIIHDNFNIHIDRYLSIPGRRLPFITQYGYQRVVERYLKSKRPDIVHAHFAYPSAFALPVTTKYGIKSVLTTHGVDFQLCIGKPPLEKVLYRNLQLADAIIAVGPKLRDEIVSFCPEVSNKTIVMLHGIDTEFFVQSENRVISKKMLGWDVEKNHILCVARIVQKKGHDLLINAISNLKAESENLVFHMIGQKSDTIWFQNLQSLLKEKEINNVLFHPPTDRVELLKYYQASDFYVQPSRDEPFGLAVAEAGSCGLPVLSTKSGGPEVIITDETGILVDADENGITEGLRQMITLHMSFDRDRISASVRDRFSTGQKQKNLTELYNRILNS